MVYVRYCGRLGITTPNNRLATFRMLTALPCYYVTGVDGAFQTSHTQCELTAFDPGVAGFSNVQNELKNCFHLMYA